MSIKKSIPVYFLSGLGADHRIFKKLKLPSHFSINYIKWIEPEASEPLSNYAFRLLPQIDITIPFILIGVSLGGIIAIEISKFVKPLQIIVISSPAYTQQMPWYLRFRAITSLVHLVPAQLLIKYSKLSRWAFNADTLEEQDLLKQILADTDPKFIRWALTVIPLWEQNIKLSNLIQLHGTADRIFPSRYINPDYIIENGGHFMIYSNAAEISKDLQKSLSSY